MKFKLNILNIKHGDIITLDNGQQAKISLEIIEKVTQLIVDKVYKLQYTGQFCHIATTSQILVDSKKELETENWRFVGKVTMTVGQRYIFISVSSTYLMFTANNLDFVIKEIK